VTYCANLLGCVVRHIRPVAKNFQVWVLILRVLGPGESEARRVEGDGGSWGGFTPPHQLECQGSAVSSPSTV